MEIKTGYLYHIKDDFFNVANDKNLMQNHEKGHKRPTYLTIKDKEILWFIPLSSKVEKYKKIVKSKIEKYGFCNTILLRQVMGVEHAILLQNAFPTLEKYIDHVHTINGVPIKVIDSLKEEILSCFKEMLKLKSKGINLFFVDVDKIMDLMMEEVVKN